jgi:hypothetical protein
MTLPFFLLIEGEGELGISFAPLIILDIIESSQNVPIFL